jgi:uncharacterized protein (DUF1778 family)
MRTDVPRSKDQTLSIRTTAEVKCLLRLAAARERRSVASMVEVLVLAYASKHDLRSDSHTLSRDAVLIKGRNL